MDEYGYSWDGEEFWGAEASHEDAAAVAIEEGDPAPGDRFDTCRFVQRTIADVAPDVRDIKYIIDRMQERVCYEIGEGGADWLCGLTRENVADLQKTVQAAIIDWANRADLDTGYVRAVDIKTHRVRGDGTIETIEENENDR